jgi:hypothetical protein
MDGLRQAVRRTPSASSLHHITSRSAYDFDPDVYLSSNGQKIFDPSKPFEVFVQHGIYVRAARNPIVGVVLGVFFPLVLVGAAGFIALGKRRAA